MAEGDNAANHLLQGRRIALIGTFASRSRLDDLIQSRGGLVVSSITNKTTLLIVGQERWPITKEGKLNPKVIQARRFQAQGSLTVLTEKELLDRLGQERPPSGSCDLSISQLSQLLRISEARLRRWVQAGLLRPTEPTASDFQFDFQQVQWAKSLRDICKSGVPLQRVRKSLERLKKWLPGIGHEHVEPGVMEKDGQLLVRLDDGRLADTKGQRFFDFGEVVQQATLEMSQDEVSADDYFNKGQEKEEVGDLGEAAEAYRQALRIGGPEPTTCFNLANVLLEMNHPKEAVDFYRSAVELNPGFAEAWNNMGNALMKLAQTKRAVEAFNKALVSDPCYWDCHYNLADAYDQLGHCQDARKHWQAYARHDPTSPWGQYARRRIGNV